MLAGHGGDAVTWLSLKLDGWITSSAFTAAPVPAVKAFVDANPIDADFGKTWARLLPDARYRSPDDAEGEAPPAGWTKVFPHVLKSASGKPDADFHAQWERSPYADAYLGRFAAALADTLKLGRHDGTDVLAISFSSPDLVGHAFGPDSQEEQDMLAHLDRTIGTLFDRLDALVGADAYVVALTADHGVTAIPEQLVRAGRDGGRINAAAIVDQAEQRAEAALGAGKYVSRLVTNDLYFEPGMYAKLKAAPTALKAVIDTIAASPGVERVFRSEELATGAASKDRLVRAAALSYFPGRSGELVIAPKAGWMAGTLGTTHGSANSDDQRVPILLMGAAVKPGEYKDPATPADVAPTLAAICGISMPKAEGHALGIALK
jgi:predicted AlkP superfamily pyrophosphatase or phosphodiesterase